MVSALAFWIAAAGIQFIHIVEKRMLCNECAANLHDGSFWEVLMSSFVFVLRQNPGLSWLVYSESPVGQKLCIIKDLQIFHKLNQFVALVNPYLVFAQAARTAENEVLHAIADSERCLGAWYGVILMLLAVVIFHP